MIQDELMYMTQNEIRIACEKFGGGIFIGWEQLILFGILAFSSIYRYEKYKKIKKIKKIFLDFLKEIYYNIFIIRK